MELNSGLNYIINTLLKNGYDLEALRNDKEFSLKGGALLKLKQDLRLIGSLDLGRLYTL
jgi:hypothetical protein